MNGREMSDRDGDGRDGDGRDGMNGRAWRRMNMDSCDLTAHMKALLLHMHYHGRVGRLNYMKTGRKIKSKSSDFLEKRAPLLHQISSFSLFD